MLLPPLNQPRIHPPRCTGRLLYHIVHCIKVSNTKVTSYVVFIPNPPTTVFPCIEKFWERQSTQCSRVVLPTSSLQLKALQALDQYATREQLDQDVWNGTGCLKKKLPLAKIGRGKYYCRQWEIHIELLQIKVKYQALLWREVNMFVHVMNL